MLMETLKEYGSQELATLLESPFSALAVVVWLLVGGLVVIDLARRFSRARSMGYEKWNPPAYVLTSRRRYLLGKTLYIALFLVIWFGISVAISLGSTDYVPQICKKVSVSCEGEVAAVIGVLVAPLIVAGALFAMRPDQRWLGMPERKVRYLFQRLALIPQRARAIIGSIKEAKVDPEAIGSMYHEFEYGSYGLNGMETAQSPGSLQYEWLRAVHLYVVLEQMFKKEQPYASYFALPGSRWPAFERDFDGVRRQVGSHLDADDQDFGEYHALKDEVEKFLSKAHDYLGYVITYVGTSDADVHRHIRYAGLEPREEPIIVGPERKARVFLLSLLLSLVVVVGIAGVDEIASGDAGSEVPWGKILTLFSAWIVGSVLLISWVRDRSLVAGRWPMPDRNEVPDHMDRPWDKYLGCFLIALAWCVVSGGILRWSLGWSNDPRTMLLAVTPAVISLQYVYNMDGMHRNQPMRIVVALIEALVLAVVAWSVAFVGFDFLREVWEQRGRLDAAAIESQLREVQWRYIMVMMGYFVGVSVLLGGYMRYEYFAMKNRLDQERTEYRRRRGEGTEAHDRGDGAREKPDEPDENEDP